MKRGDKYKTPAIDFTGTKTEIEAITYAEVGMHAVATNNPTAPMGVYNGVAWIWGGSGGIMSVVAGTGIDVDVTDPANPIVSVTEPESGNVTQVDCSGGTSDTYGVLAGAVNGINKVFTVSLPSYVSGSLQVYLNGQLLTQGASEDWVELLPSSGTFEMSEAPVSGDFLIATYKRSIGSTVDADTLDGYEASAFMLKAEIGAGTEEFDFGLAGDISKTKTITNALVTTTSRIVATINYDATTNNSADDILIQELAVKIGNKSAGQFDMTVDSILGLFLYEVGVDYLIYY